MTKSSLKKELTFVDVTNYIFFKKIKSKSKTK